MMNTKLHITACVHLYKPDLQVKYWQIKPELEVFAGNDFD